MKYSNFSARFFPCTSQNTKCFLGNDHLVLIRFNRDVRIVDFGETCNVPAFFFTKVQQSFELVLMRNLRPIKALGVYRSNRLSC